ncbi:MAG TPA: two-component regulator propeller domain-containing protein [Blastocatellia bacterium]|nr:two-component regulator propeller domain-containing protein [Blastocatellia bacterium]
MKQGKLSDVEGLRHLVSGPAISVVLVLMALIPSNAPVHAERLPLRTYTTADGLAHNRVNRIVRDSRGFLWFCTGEGLSRFDGYTFVNYGVEQGLPHNEVTDFIETRGGELWVATWGGLVHFNPKGSPAAHVVDANEADASAAMFSVVVPEDDSRDARATEVILEGRDGTIWCGTNKHLYQLDRGEDRFSLLAVEVGTGIPKQVAVTDLLEDRGGSVWVASFVGLFRRRPDGAVEQYTKLDGLPDNNIHDLLEDHEGRLWAGTRQGGFFRFAVGVTDNRLVVAESYDRRKGLLTEWIAQLQETSDHRFWLATNQGLVEFVPGPNRQTGRFRAYTRKNGLTYQEITAVTEDTSGNLWLGTNVAGAMKLAPNGFVTYDEQDGLAGVYAIFEDPAGGVCFRANVFADQRPSAFNGAQLDLLRPESDRFSWRFGRFDGQRFDWFTPAVQFEFGWVGEHTVVQTPDGEWWVGSGSGLYRFPASESFARIKMTQPLAVYTTKHGLAAQQIFRLFADSGGNVWVSPFGLARWDRAGQSLRNWTSVPSLPSFKQDPPRSFGEDRAGNIWIGFGTGVARYSGGAFTFFTAGDGVPPGAIFNIHSDRAGRLWLASARSGLIRVDDPTAERPEFTTLATAQGLSSNSTNEISEDLYGRIYVSTGHGLDQLDPATGRIKHFTAADGLAPGDIIAAFCDHGGEMWFGTPRGLSRFVPAPPQATSPPTVLITGLNVAGERPRLSALGETEIVLPELKSGQNQIEIQFVALGFSLGEELRYQYKLEGASDDWSPLTEQRLVNFVNMSPGRYRLLLRAMNADGVLSETPATLSFRILPPIWQRWWFMVLAAALVAAIAYSFYRYRLARLLEVERVRTRIASDLHDDIGANLTRIAILSEVAHSQFGDQHTTVDSPLSSIARISRESVASMSDIIWAINPKRDTLFDVTQRMRKHATEVFAGRNIEFEFRAPDSEDALKLGADIRRDLFLIFKEAVSNAARHAACSNVQIELRIEHSRLVLEMEDNGRGFDTEAPSEGNGLVSMKRRAASLGGEFELESIEGKGTRIILMVPR